MARPATGSGVAPLRCKSGIGKAGHRLGAVLRYARSDLTSHARPLIVAGEPLTLDAPQYIDALSHAIAGARVVLMPAESTVINMDQPEAFNRIVLDFLDAINRPPKQ